MPRRPVSDLEIVPIPNGQFAENCYLLATNGRAILIDPGEEWERFLAELEARKLTLEGIWLTHAHLDHILGVGDVQKATGAPIWLHPADRALSHRLYGGGLEACVAAGASGYATGSVEVGAAEGIDRVFALAPATVGEPGGESQSYRVRLTFENGAYRIDKLD